MPVLSIRVSQLTVGVFQRVLDSPLDSIDVQRLILDHLPPPGDKVCLCAADYLNDQRGGRVVGRARSVNLNGGGRSCARWSCTTCRT